MSDIEDGELLSSDNEANFTNPLARKEAKKERKTKHKDKNHLDTNNNFQNNHEHRNFPRNNESRYNKIKSSQALRPHFNERKRNGHSKIDLKVNKKKKPRFELKEKVSQEKCASHQIESSNVEQTHPEIPVIPKRRILCKYYAGGECKNGVACAFMHQDFPCKFFHDKNSVCRAGSDCKYSHAPLSDDMQIIIDYFIQEGKEHKTITEPAPTVVPSYSLHNTVHNRTKYLLPTPITNNPQQNASQHQFNSNNNSNLLNHEEPEKPKPHTNIPIINYRLKYSEPLVPGICPLNKPRNVSNNYSSKPVKNKYPKKQSEFHIKHSRHLTDSSASLSYENPRENYVPDFYLPKPEPIALMDIDFSAPPPCEIRLNPAPVSSQNLSHFTHAPARFIIGNSNEKNFSVEKPNNGFYEHDFTEALMKLAAQVIAEPAEMPLSPENQTVDANDKEDSPKLEIQIKEPSVHSMKQENVVMTTDPVVETNEASTIKQEKIEVPTVRIAENTSIFNINVNEMSESEKQYIDEMKSLINFDAQFETKIRWVAVQLDPIEKQPYILYRLGTKGVHENASSDPRLFGHPVLRELEHQNDSDDEEAHASQTSCNTSEDEDDYDVFHQKPLNIDLGLPDVQSNPECDTRSYLYDCKFKRKKISQHILL